MNSPTIRIPLADIFSDENLAGDLQLSNRKNKKQLLPGIQSLSHSGRWVLVGTLQKNSPNQIGVDLELTDRVDEDVESRILQKKERSGPWPAALWCAKEAAWKAVRGSRQPKVTSQLLICDWKKRSKPKWKHPHAEWGSPFDFFSFGFENEIGFESNQGVCFRWGPWTIAVVLANFSSPAPTKTESN